MAKVTKPKQAGSSRSLDYWQVELKECIGLLSMYHHGSPPPGVTCGACQAATRLTRLLASMQKAERR